MSVVRCQVEVSATSWSLVQRSPTEYAASVLCDLENLVNEEAIAREIELQHPSPPQKKTGIWWNELG